MNYQITNYPINKAIACMSGNSGLTEEFIYSTTQLSGKRYTVLSSSTDDDTMMGEVPLCDLNGKPLKVFEGKEGLLVARNGKAGTTRYLKPGYYTINDHAYILSVKDSCPYEINIKWLAIQYKADFLSYSSSSDNGTWNKTGFFKNVTLDIPSIDEQNNLVKITEKALHYLSKINKIIKKLEKNKDKEFSVDYHAYQAQNIPIDEIFSCLSGNSGLTQEFIYNNLGQGVPKYKVLSGATRKENYMGIIPDCRLNGKNIKVFTHKEGLLIIRKGKAGCTKFLEKGSYTINDDAYIIYIKEGCKYKINLQWFEYQYKREIIAYASSSDNGTWNKTGFFSNVKIDIPDIIEQEKLVSIIHKANIYLEKFYDLQEKLTDLTNRELSII